MCAKTGGGKSASLSDQAITSCDTRNDGCSGGYPSTAMEQGGLCSLESYPYTDCKNIDVKISEVVQVQASEQALIAAIQKSPVAVAVAAGNNAWKQYKSGVLSSCDTCQTDHGVLANGYTNDA
ncbi:TPA: hypothetical protein N0F65_012259 [Lagenidium giganteum]|uniref:Peptidase C1A papain C-terminal domain-containing protein n=1 Tax=Lagenidium giganteum TaxID=4803 RepID=A0AAV2ZB69_9STRA|nr:TPA: hypothetical protein N0F65_012259 [Lagenidium giganteum]